MPSRPGPVLAPTRIPTLPIGRMVDENGNPTQQEITFRQTLITNLNNNFGSQGCVVPTQNQAGIDLIVNQIAPNPLTGQVPMSGGQYVVQFGTILYNSSTGQIQICVPTSFPGNMTPIFKTVTLT